MESQDMAMQAMLTAASGMGGGAPFTAPGAAPPMHLDPNMAAQAYMQMFQYVQQSLAAQGVPGGLPGAPPLPFPGLPPAPYAGVPQAEPTVRVSVEGMKFQYQLTEDDLHKVFSRYGSVRKIRVDDVGASASIIFGSYQDAQSAINDLNGKVLNGLEGTLSLSWITAPSPSLPAPPYPGMPYPNWGFPPMPTAQAWSSPPVPQAPVPCPTAAAAPNMRPSAAAGVPAMQRGVPDRSAGGKGQRKFTCRFIIGIENDKDFQVARRIIGAKGANMKKIVKHTDAKLRLRGVGSGYFEGTGQKESSEPLQLCISCTSEEGYRLAVKNVEELLHRVYDEYRVYCKDAGREAPDVQINFTENQLVYNSRAAFSAGPSPFPDDDDDDDVGDAGGKGRKGKGGSKALKARRDAITSPTGEIERGEPGPNAPTVEEIEKYIDERNEARRANNFPEADRIRQLLHSRGVALMDEPGGRGRGTEVTTWRYWRD
eukprot:TRINITY_DN363_c0_g2_i1.p1 TRINITY_DN363_c0_g2~~TRINITY_DN363_c0_g2_i1.p1  ORF type:complete len:483 (-),score=89.23 TRINITY_DN363_c0_g2_i1:135-1583(-)